jgi:class 3 adenylate cyclase
LYQNKHDVQNAPPSEGASTPAIPMPSLSHLSVKSKLIMMLLAVSGFSILVTALLGYRSGQSNLTNRAFDQLTSVRASKAHQIENYFRNISNHTQTLSEDPSIIAAVQEFSSAYNQLGKLSVPQTYKDKLASYYGEMFLPRLKADRSGTPILQSYLLKPAASNYLQYHYIAANPNPVGKKQLMNQAADASPYSMVHGRYHPIFRNLIERFGYYDMFLISPDGTIVYTVFKETDFASNLMSGPYRDSNLARLVRKVKDAKQKDFTRLIDFEAYAPSYDAPAAFIAAPIYKQSQLLGILAFQMPVNEINNVMTGNRRWKEDGLGSSGETYLVGSDRLMRSISRFMIEDPKAYISILRKLSVKEDIIKRIQQFETSILLQRVDTKGVSEALAGKEGTEIIRDYRNIPVLSSFAPLKIDGLDWVILSEMNLSEAFAPIHSFQRQVLITATLLILLITLLAMALAHLFVKPINKLIASARRVAAGELTTIPAVESGDEFGELGRSFNSMVLALRSQQELVERKNQENEQLLLSVFPPSIARRLQRGDSHIAEEISNVAVLVSDLSGFTTLSRSLTASESVAILNDLVAGFDDAADLHGIEKIKTNGDSYLAVCGLSAPYLDHDKRAIDFAIEMVAIVRRFNLERGLQLGIQIGINSGDIVAGIVGKSKVIYDVWGETVNHAVALKDVCPPGTIVVSQTVHHRLEDLYQFEELSGGSNRQTADINAWRLKSNLIPINLEKRVYT